MLRICSAVALAAALGLVGVPRSSHAQDAAAPVRGGVLVQSTDVEPASMDPGFGNAPGVDVRSFRPVYETLFYQDEEGQLIPQLATDWTVSEDGLTMDFDIRQGVSFQDGTPLDAEAVVCRNRSDDFGSRNGAQHNQTADGRHHRAAHALKDACRDEREQSGR